MNIWFSSDHHLYHNNILKYSNRSFDKDQEMADCFIENHNSLVKPKDTVYWLGDFAWNLREDSLEKLINKFNGKKHFILGNHDKPSFYNSLCKKRLFESVNQTLGISINDKYIWLSHYPHRSWNKSFHGSYHLHGHCHGSVFPFGLSFDVGVDCWDYKPISFDQVEQVMDKFTRQFAETPQNERGERQRWFGLQENK